MIFNFIKRIIRITSKLMNLLAVRSYRNIFLRYGVAASVEHEAVLLGLQNIKVVVDVGANKGQFAIVAKEIFPESTIYSFEPLNKPGTKFKKIFSKDNSIIFISCAIGERSDTTMMHVSRKDDSSSLYPISNLQVENYPGTIEVGLELVEIRPLYHYITRENLSENALLKIDVQGYELEVLKGCEALLSSFKWIYAECSFIELYSGQAMAPTVISWLDGRNFKIAGIYNVSYDKYGKCIQSDILFVKI